MTSRFIVFSTIALLASAATLEAQSGAREWSVNNTDAMSYGVPYELYNGSRQIGYDERTFGVNLGWVGHSGGHFEFRRKAAAGTTDHRRGQIPPDADISIWSTKAQRYLVYQRRGDTEAELGWSRTPVYEWRAEDQSASGGRVYFALYNNRAKKYLVYQRKNYGINLGWLNTGPSAAQSYSVALRAQQIIQGWIPYLGSFGQNTQGNLLSVKNASQTATLMFVKPGRSTTQSSDPAATERVAPGASMTATQMKTLYGSETPRLPVTFLACAATTGTQYVSLTYLNITYKLDN